MTVVGQGAIGLLVACRLQLAGIPVRLWLKQPQESDITFSEADQKHQCHFPVANGLPLQTVFIPVKTYDVLTCFRQLQPYLKADAQLILSHNGMGVFEQLLPLLTAEQGLWFLSTAQGTMKVSVDHAQHTGQGHSYLAPLNPAAHQQLTSISGLMQLAFSPLALVEDIYPYLWQKLAVNAAINPLTALYNCRNGELAETDSASIIPGITKEVCQVASAAGYPLPYAETLRYIMQVIQLTAGNYSSMQQDIQQQRTTEIEAINGYVVAKAMQFGINVPVNQQLSEQVIKLQQTYGR